jgi:hypothetical protein
MQRLEQRVAGGGAGAGSADCCSSSGVELRRAGVAGSDVVPLVFSAGRDAGGAAARAGAAAAAEAARNADAGNPGGYQAKQASRGVEALQGAAVSKLSVAGTACRWPAPH